MNITSLYFVLLSVVAVFVYYLLKHRYRALFLTLLSAGFIATYSYVLLAYVLGYVLLNYLIGIRIPDARKKKLLVTTGILLNLSQLILLKYASFTINPLFHLLHIQADATLLARIIIPIGVSFFTLQGIGYLVNVSMGWEKPESDFVHFLLYIIFYPRFLSGPIDRSNHFLPQLKVSQSFSEENIIQGFRLILFGLFKKVAIADQLATAVNGAYAHLGTTGDFTYWIVLLIQPLYLYFDFSGYTDIAFGIARSFGLELRPNFNRPFMSENMTEFWKRFHISLSSWFHDYVFMRTFFRIRKWGKNATTYALFLTWILFGIWHGAGWTFMLLGLLQALAVYYEFSTKRWRVRIFARLPGALRTWMGRIFTYVFYAISLTFFFAPDIHSVLGFFSRLPVSHGWTPGGMNDEIFLLSMFFAFIILLFEWLKNDFAGLYDRVEALWYGNKMISKGFRWGLYLFAITIVIVFNNEVQEFIYFQF
jgi:alginate O-acetyltransferase complex protein AlgI